MSDEVRGAVAGEDDLGVDAAAGGLGLAPGAHPGLAGAATGERRSIGRTAGVKRGWSSAGTSPSASPAATAASHRSTQRPAAPAVAPRTAWSVAAVARAAAGQVEEHVVPDHLEGRHVRRGGGLVAGLDEAAEHGAARRIEGGGPLDAHVAGASVAGGSERGAELVGALVGDLGDDVEGLGLLTEAVVEGQEVADVAGEVVELGGRERAAGPIVLL